MKSKFLDVSKMRHSVYHLGRKIGFSADQIVDLIEGAVNTAPTPFNNQSVRVVILLGASQDKVWNVIAQTVKKIVGDEKFKNDFAPKITSFKAGYGTVLFYTDSSTVNDTAAKVTSFPKSSFLEWAEQAQGNAQVYVWDALAEQHIGASIHHYHNLLGEKIDQALAENFAIPDDWQLSTEMVFGSIEKAVQPKPLIEDAKKFRVFK